MNGDERRARCERISGWLLPHVGMLLLLPRRNADASEVICNGTASFVNTGQSRLIITCGHVIDRFNEIRVASPEAILAVSGSSRTPPVVVSDAEVIDNGGRQIDLATLRLPDPDRITRGGKRYFHAEDWPPPQPTPGQVAVMTGFPGMHREPSARGLEVRATCICDFVTSVSDRNIVLADENLERNAIMLNRELTELGPLGGMSGSAVYVVDEERQVPTLVGFLYEAGEGTDAKLFIARATYIREDGTFDRNSMPW